MEKKGFVMGMVTKCRLYSVRLTHVKKVRFVPGHLEFARPTRALDGGLAEAGDGLWCQVLVGGAISLVCLLLS